MATVKLPDALARRHLLEGGVDPAKALGIAEAYLEAERELEAIAFLRAAEPASNERARSLLETLRDYGRSRLGDERAAAAIGHVERGEVGAAIRVVLPYFDAAYAHRTAGLRRRMAATFTA